MASYLGIVVKLAWIPELDNEAMALALVVAKNDTALDDEGRSGGFFPCERERDIWRRLRTQGQRTAQTAKCGQQQHQSKHITR